MKYFSVELRVEIAPRDDIINIHMSDKTVETATNVADTTLNITHQN